MYILLCNRCSAKLSWIYTEAYRIIRQFGFKVILYNFKKLQSTLFIYFSTKYTKNIVVTLLIYVRMHRTKLYKIYRYV